MSPDHLLVSRTLLLIMLCACALVGAHPQWARAAQGAAHGSAAQAVEPGPDAAITIDPAQVAALELLFSTASTGAESRSASVAQSSVTPAPVQPQVLNLYVGQAHVIDEADVRRIVIGNGKIIQATALDDRQVLVIPEAAGQSTLHLWMKDGPQKQFVINVIAADTARLLAEIQAMLGVASNLSVRVVGDKVVIEGARLTEEQAVRLVEVSRRFPQIVNLVSRVGFERMITIDVKMVEIRREAVQNIGVKWNGTAQGPAFGIVGDLQRSGALQPGGRADGVAGLEIRPRVPPFSTSAGIASSLTSMINLMVQNGDAVVLAEPTLSCRSGGSARFIAGGELPIPHSTSFGNMSVVFKEYGIKFDVAPTASEAGVIAAKVATEISAINFDVVVKDVPGLTKRRAETDVNLRPNETLVIAGMLSEETTKNVDQVPALGEIPILGKLFRSRAFRDRQTELVVFVTPRFAQAQETGESQAAQRMQVEPAGQRIEQARERVRMVE